MIILRSEREIAKIRESSRIARTILERLISEAKAGIKTQSLDDIALSLMKQYECGSGTIGYRGYPKHICVSVNDEVVHGIPGARALRENDLVSIDVCVHKDGYYGDCAETVVLGEPDDEKKRLIDTGKRALNEAIAKALPGNRIEDISYAIETTASSEGYSVVRDFTGHGIGTAMHEDPKIPNYGKPNTGPRIRTGMVFAIEVMMNAGTWEVKVLDDNWTVVTRDGRLSVHFEHTVAITKDGNEVLTCLKKK
jgi:methionyl aminopeptidase